MKNQNETKDENLSKILINFTKIHKNFFFNQKLIRQKKKNLWKTLINFKKINKKKIF